MAINQSHPLTLREAAHCALICNDSIEKVRLVGQLDTSWPIGEQLVLQSFAGRPEKPELVHPRKVPVRGLNDMPGRAMLLHSLAHIEFNAINLALDLVVRFECMPVRFYLDWVRVAQEEACHHVLLCERLAAHNVQYGDFPAHDGLWQMAEKTKDSLMARLALVPRLMEARGLDVSPGIRQKLDAVGDIESAKVLDIILRDEIGHVAIGNQWFNKVCSDEGLDPIEAFEQCLKHYAVPMPRSPFNFPAREMAGFSDKELAWLLQLELEQTR